MKKVIFVLTILCVLFLIVTFAKNNEMKKSQINSTIALSSNIKNKDISFLEKQIEFLESKKIKNSFLDNLIREAKIKNYDFYLLKALSHGAKAIYFDVDGTFLDNASVNDKFSDYPYLLNTVINLLSQGVQVGFISGNNYKKQLERIVQPLIDEMKKQNKLKFIKNFSANAMNGAYQVTFDENGISKFEMLNNKNFDNYLRGTKEVFLAFSKRGFDLKEEEKLLWKKYYSYYSQVSGKKSPFEMDDIDVVSKHSEASGLISIENRENCQINIDINMPSDEKRIQKIIYSFKNFPFYQEFSKNDIKTLIDTSKKFRTAFAKEIEREMKKEGIVVFYSVATSGIDVSEIHKGMALKTLIESSGIKDTKSIYYFGNEFVKGNDKPVADYEASHEIPEINIISVGDDPKLKYLLWVGSDFLFSHIALHELDMLNNLKMFFEGFYKSEIIINKILDFVMKLEPTYLELYKIINFDKSNFVLASV